MIKLNPCPYCKGTGEFISIIEDLQTKRKRWTTSFCICKQSEFISQKYKQLDYLKDYYVDIEEVEKSLIFLQNDLAHSPNYLIFGPKQFFHLFAKSIIIKYSFTDPDSSIWLSNSIDIIHNFHVPQSDGETPHLSSTDSFDLIIASFGVSEENKALRYSMTQIVQNRKSRRPTWIYVPHPTLSGTKEYSPELEALVKDFKVVDLSGYSKEKITVVTQSQKAVANFNLGGK